jgi:6-phosphogluconolactonase (cycloisomerase 2 family)
MNRLQRSPRVVPAIKMKTICLGLLFAVPGLLALSSPIFAQATPPRFAYVASASGGSVPGYAIDAISGALSPLAGSPFPLVGSPGGLNTIAAHPSGQFLYGADPNGRIHGYRIHADGALTPLSGFPFTLPLERAPIGMLIDPTGKFAYTVNYPGLSGFQSIGVFAIDQVTGGMAPVPGSPFSIGQSTSFFIGPFAIDPLGRFLYITDEQHPDLYAFAIDHRTGGLTPVVGSPFPTGSESFAVTVHPNGRFAYAAAVGQLWEYAVNQTTGALTKIEIFPLVSSEGGELAVRIALDPTGHFLYAPTESDRIFAFSISSNGTLIANVLGSPFSTGSRTQPFALAMEPTKPLVYVTLLNARGVKGYTRDNATGTLTEMAGSPFVTNGEPRHIVTTSGPGCVDSLNVTYAAGTLHLGFTLFSSQPTLFSSWLFAPPGGVNLWSAPIQAIPTAISADLPIPGFPSIGPVAVLTSMVGQGISCWDLEVVNTSAPVGIGHE